MIARSSTDVVVTAKRAELLSRVALARPKPGSKSQKPVEGANLSTASTSTQDPETTGSVAPGTPERPRIIAPDQIPVPAVRQ